MSNNKLKVGFRSSGRLLAVQGLYMMEASGEKISKVIDNLKIMVKNGDIEHLEEKFCDFELTKKIIQGVIDNQSEIDQLIIKNLPENWTIKKIDNVVRSCLRSGLFELLYDNDLDNKIVLKEYMNLSSAFGLNVNKDMIGGLLNNVAHNMGKI